MKKTIAQQLREDINRLEARGAAASHEIEVTVSNWQEPQSEEDDWDEERLVLVGFNIEGQYRPASWGYNGGDPEEHPDLDIVSITDAETGEDVSQMINDRTMKYIIDQCWEYYDNNH